jgi:hypothetical protein
MSWNNDFLSGTTRLFVLFLILAFSFVFLFDELLGSAVGFLVNALPSPRPQETFIMRAG